MSLKLVGLGCAAVTSAAYALHATPQARVATAEQPRLVEWSKDGQRADPLWLTNADIRNRFNTSKPAWSNFIDLTGRNLSLTTTRASPIPSKPSQQSYVTPLLAKVSQDNLRATMVQLSSYFTRFKTTQTGVDAAKWIATEFTRIAALAGRTDVNVVLYTHSDWPQESVIATITGVVSKETVIVGAHEDSIAGGGGVQRAPGADDDASGIATMLEAFRVLMEAGFRPQRTVQFVAFAAEEGGLMGSTDLVENYYLKDNIPIMAMLQSEMSGYRYWDDITVMEDAYTDPSVSGFVSELIPTYTTWNRHSATCGSCSDHAPFNKAGYRVTCIAESGPYGQLNPYIHTSRDTVDVLSMEQIQQFGRLIVGFVVEMAQAPLA